jgi:hypothetical protein
MFGLQESQTAATPVATAVSVPGATIASPPQPLSASTSNEPIGAIVLIVLGVAFLVGSMTHFHIGKLWPLVLIGIGLWIAYKRTTVKA